MVTVKTDGVDVTDLVSNPKETSIKRLLISPIKGRRSFVIYVIFVRLHKNLKREVGRIETEPFF